jgi:hypothetical protein
MVKDKYLKESLNTQRLGELAKKYNLANYIPGQSFESVKNNMSAEDYETSQKLLNYYANQESITDDYNYNNNIIEQNQKKTLQENAISKELAMKYLPEHLKLQGMGGLGVSESAVISANNDFRNARNTINADAEMRKNELLKNYQDSMRTLDENSTTETQSIRDKYFAREEEEREQQKAAIDYHFHTEMLTNPDYFTEDGTKLTEDGKNKIREYLDNNKGVLGGLHDTYMQELDTYAVYTNKERLEKEEAERKELENQNMAYSLGGSGTGVSADAAQESDFGSYHDTGKTGTKQSAMVDKILNMAKRGEIQDGTYIDFNYGAGWVYNTGSVWVYYGGKFYPTTYSRNDAMNMSRKGTLVLGYDNGNAKYKKP